jgi:hypothetical protein
MDNVHDAIMDGEMHPGQAEFDDVAFLADIIGVLGPEAPEGDWISERYDRAVVLNVPNAGVIELLPRIQRVANRHSLNVAAQL